MAHAPIRSRSHAPEPVHRPTRHAAHGRTRDPANSPMHTHIAGHPGGTVVAVTATWADVWIGGA